jgi:uncharacterized protein YxeA
VTAGFDHYQYGISSDAVSFKSYKLSFDVDQYYVKAHANYFASEAHSFEMGVSNLLYQLHPGSFQPNGKGIHRYSCYHGK